MIMCQDDCGQPAEVQKPDWLPLCEMCKLEKTTFEKQKAAWDKFASCIGEEAVYSNATNAVARLQTQYQGCLVHSYRCRGEK